MHKLYLTETESSIIHGAEQIIEEIGGFPSMENGTLSAILIRPITKYRRYCVVLEFDIEGWYETAKHYADVEIGEHKKIRMVFWGVRDICIRNAPDMNACGEIKFGNTCDIKKMRQDDHPSNTPVVERPFCSFYIGNGHSLIIEFFEEECKISARFVQ